MVSGVEALHVLEVIDVRYPFVGALRIIIEVDLSLDKMYRNGRLHFVFGLITRNNGPVVRSMVPEGALRACSTINAASVKKQLSGLTTPDSSLT